MGSPSSLCSIGIPPEVALSIGRPVADSEGLFGVQGYKHGGHLCKGGTEEGFVGPTHQP